MRKKDKTANIQKVNLLTEVRHALSKSINESDMNVGMKFAEMLNSQGYELIDWDLKGHDAIISIGVGQQFDIEFILGYEIESKPYFYPGNLENPPEGDDGVIYYKLINAKITNLEGTRVLYIGKEPFIAFIESIQELLSDKFNEKIFEDTADYMADMELDRKLQSRQDEFDRDYDR